MRRFLGVLFATVLLAPLGACASVASADFDVVARPTECSIVAPQSADPRAFLRCDAASTCVTTEEGRTACYAVAVAGTEGDACDAQNQCGPGLSCTSLFGCLRACDLGSACADGTACNAFSDGGARYGYCNPPSCDPLHARRPEGEGLVACATNDCYFVGPSRTACFASAGIPRGVEGATCTDDRFCPVGDSCFEGKCTRLCRVGGSECGASGTCVPGASDVGKAELVGVAYGHCE